MRLPRCAKGSLEFIGCSAHLLVAGFPEWHGVKLLCAQSQGMYWFLVMRSDLGIARGDLAALKGRHIGAAHWVAMGLRRLLAEAGIDAEREGIEIAPIPGAHGAGINFGVTAAKALEDGKVDGFWANGMGAEIAVRRGIGTVVLDVRRGDGPKPCFNYTMPVIAAADELIARSPETADSRGARHRQHAGGVAQRREPRFHGGAQALSRHRSGPDRRSDPSAICRITIRRSHRSSCAA